MNIITAINGYVGTRPLVNGVNYPEARTARSRRTASAPVSDQRAPVRSIRSLTR